MTTEPRGISDYGESPMAAIHREGVIDRVERTMLSRARGGDLGIIIAEESRLPLDTRPCSQVLEQRLVLLSRPLSTRIPYE